MSDNTVQYSWIVRLVSNLQWLLKDEVAFVAGDLMWYPVQVEPKETPPAQAPDAMVVLGRPAKDRGSYKQWEEDNIAPQVVFEILSPSNTAKEMLAKQVFYKEHGVLEMFFYDPDSKDFWGFARENPDQDCTLVTPLNLPWTSPLLKIRFALFEDGLEVCYPNGEPFKEPQAIFAEREQERLARQQVQEELAQTQAERDEVKVERDEAKAEQERLRAKLRELGVDPDAI